MGSGSHGVPEPEWRGDFDLMVSSLDLSDLLDGGPDLLELQPYLSSPAQAHPGLPSSSLPDIHPGRPTVLTPNTVLHPPTLRPTQTPNMRLAQRPFVRSFKRNTFAQ